MGRVTQKILLVVFGIVLIAILGMAIFVGSQRSIIYNAQKYTPEEEAAVLAKYGINESSRIGLVTKDKVKINAYWMPSESSKTVPTIVYLHVSPPPGLDCSSSI